MEIMSLPEEVLSHILGSLHIPDRLTRRKGRNDIFKARLVCRQWNKTATRHAFRTVFMATSIKGLLSWHKLMSSGMVKSAARRIVIFSSKAACENIETGSRFFLPSQAQESGVPYWDATRISSFWTALSRLDDLTLVNEICLRFSWAASAVDDRINPIEDSAGTRVNFLQIVFHAIEARARRPGTAKIRSLTIKNLQNFPIPTFTSSDVFKSVTKHLDRLQLDVVEESHIMDSSSDLHLPERVRFEPYLHRAWLMPMASQLTSLSLHFRECWGTMPGTFNGEGLVFPHLKNLSLGRYTISNHDHLDWVLSQSSLKSLRLGRCFIVSYMWLKTYMVEEWGPKTHDWEQLRSGAFGYHELDDLVYHFPGTWESVFDKIRTRLPNLVDFQFNSHLRTRHFDNPNSFATRLSPSRYVAFGSPMTGPWIHAERHHGELDFGDYRPLEEREEALRGLGGDEADTKEERWKPPVKPNRARETEAGDRRALEALQKATIERRR